MSSALIFFVGCANISSTPHAQAPGGPPQDSGVPPQDSSDSPQESGVPPQESSDPPQDSGGPVAVSTKTKFKTIHVVINRTTRNELIRMLGQPDDAKTSAASKTEIHEYLYWHKKPGIKYKLTLVTFSGTSNNGIMDRLTFRLKNGVLDFML
jgi:hypothetical protein